MKQLFTIVAAVLFTAGVFAQTPQKMSYQAVIRNGSNTPVTNTQIGMQISILQGSVSGTVVYTETQTPTTNANGLVSIEIGGETGFSSIDWASDIYFIKTETDPTGGTDYTITGTSQLLSVPYALHSKTAENLTGTITETDPVYAGSQAVNITATDITNLGNLSGINSGDQDLSGFLTGYTETDPVYTLSEASNITATDITNLGNLSGINTGDQDLSSLAPTTALADSTAQLRSEIPDVSGFITTETDPNAVLLTNNQTIAGDKTFTGIVTVPEPVNPTDAATKAYVDELRIMVLDLIAESGVTDIDNNHYEAVRIGSQLWMAENLKTTRYNDGTPIPLVTDSLEWDNLVTPAYCWYRNDPVTYGETYGALYNLHVVSTGILCPSGWHVPSDAEWTVLSDYLGGESVAGGKLKEAGTTHWYTPNAGATNETGFTALPGGIREAANSTPGLYCYESF